MPYLNSGLTELSEAAFANCRSLEEIVIPKNIIRINTYAFSESGLKEVQFEQGSQLQQIDLSNAPYPISFKLSGNFISIKS